MALRFFSESIFKGPTYWSLKPFQHSVSRRSDPIRCKCRVRLWRWRSADTHYVLEKFSVFRCYSTDACVDSQSMNVFLCLPLARLPSIIPISAMASNLFLFWEEDAGWNLIFGIEAKDTAPKELNYCYVLLLCHLTAFWAADLASVS